MFSEEKFDFEMRVYGGPVPERLEDTPQGVLMLCHPMVGGFTDHEILQFTAKRGGTVTTSGMVTYYRIYDGPLCILQRSRKDISIAGLDSDDSWNLIKGQIGVINSISFVRVRSNPTRQEAHARGMAWIERMKSNA